MLKRGSLLWRAQNGHLWRPDYQYDPETDARVLVGELPSPFTHDRMKPLTNSATEGRANSKGIPCLYLATDKETAMSEVRPWIGGIMSVARLKLSNNVKLIDFRVVDKEQFKFYLNEPSDEKKLEAVWFYINNAFSKPIKLSETKSDYVPTQIISELIRTKGYDGILYTSSLANGSNIAIFNLDSAEVVDCNLFEASKIEYSFKNVDEF